MLIKLLKVHGFELIGLSGYHNVEFTPEEVIQIILGTNGSGKSSLARLLTPYPPNHQFFKKPGLHQITIEQENNNFVLTCSFNDKNEYSFIKNDEELNIGRNLTIQKQLVYDTFGIDKNINDLVFGDILFTRLSPLERRNWFIKMSSNNYSYAMAIWKKINDNIKDLTGAVKVNKTRLAKELEKSIVLDEIHTTTFSNFKRELTFLLELKTFDVDNNKRVNDFKNLTTIIQNQLNVIEKKLEYLSLIKSESPIDNKTMAVVLETKYTKTELLIQQKYRLDQINELMIKNHETIDEYKRLNNKDAVKLEWFINETIERILNIKKIIISPFTIDQPRLFQETVYSIMTPVSDLIRELSLEDIDSLKNEVSLNDDLILIIKDINSYEEDKKMLFEKLLSYNNLLSGSKTTCPNCSHEWHLNYDELKHKETSDKLDNINKTTDLLYKTKKEIEDKLIKITEIKQKINQLLTIRQSTPLLKNFWSYIKENNIIKNNIIDVINLLESSVEDCNKLLLIESLEKEIKEAEEALKIIYKNNTSNITKLIEETEQLDKDYYYLKNNIPLLNNDIKIINIFEKESGIIDDLISKLENNLTLYDENLEKLYDVFFQSELNKDINELKTKMVSLEEKERIHEQQQTKINLLQSQITQDEETLNNYKILSTTLSPVDGLIAEGLMGFMQYFLDYVNKLIAGIWTYPLEVCLPSFSDSDFELDFKFPIKKRNGFLSSDINKGSDAMIEICDLAFRLVTLKFLNKEHMLFLDEFGRSFDTRHRETAYSAIRNLINSQGYQQAVIINHYPKIINSFRRAGYNVLNEQNIELPNGVEINKNMLLS